MILIPNDILTSPKLLKFVEAFQAAEEKQDVLANFWQEVEVQGAPLMEKLEEQPEYYLVTFLYREKAETDELLLNCGALGAVPTRGIFKQIPDTDIYYKSIFFLNQTRTQYFIRRQKVFVPNYRLETVKRNFQEPIILEERFNTKHLIFRYDDENPEKFATISILELPDAPKQPWIQEQSDVKKGTIEEFELNYVKAKDPAKSHKISVYLPPNYSTDHKPYGIAFFFDGSWYNNKAIPTPTILDNLIAHQKILPLIGVFISQQNRMVELAMNKDFAIFIVEQVIQKIRENYNVTTDPKQSIIVGMSIGGLMAAYIGLRHSNIFGKVLSQSGSFFAPEHVNPMGNPDFQIHNYLISEYVKTDRVPVDFYLEIGIYEGREMLFGPPSPFFSHRHMHDVLLLKGYNVRYEEYRGGHDFTCWRGSLADGLIHLTNKL